VGAGQVEVEAAQPADLRRHRPLDVRAAAAGDGDGQPRVGDRPRRADLVRQQTLADAKHAAEHVAVEAGGRILSPAMVARERGRGVERAVDGEGELHRPNHAVVECTRIAQWRRW